MHLILNAKHEQMQNRRHAKPQQNSDQEMSIINYCEKYIHILTYHTLPIPSGCRHILANLINLLLYLVYYHVIIVTSPIYTFIFVDP